MRKSTVRANLYILAVLVLIFGITRTIVEPVHGAETKKTITLTGNSIKTPVPVLDEAGEPTGEIVWAEPDSLYEKNMANEYQKKRKLEI